MAAIATATGLLKDVYGEENVKEVHIGYNNIYYYLIIFKINATFL